MVKKTLRFSKPVNITERSLDGVKIRFPFTMVDTELIGAPEERNRTTTHRIDVTISRSLLCIVEWNEINEEKLQKILFEIAKRKIKEILQTRELTEQEKLKVDTYTYPDQKIPFDPDRIEEPDGAVIEIEVNNKIGFK